MPILASSAFNHRMWARADGAAVYPWRGRRNRLLFTKASDVVLANFAGQRIQRPAY
jgi:hypothetical protein